MTSDNTIENPELTTPKRLWFGFGSAALAWSIAGIVNVMLAWQACMGNELGSGPFTPTGMHIMLGLITFGLLAVSIASGVVSFRNWRKLSDHPDIVTAEARGRRQFMAMAGVLISTSLTLGIIWFAIPIYWLSPCMRAR